MKLSDRLYDNAQHVSATARQIIENHMKGVHRAEELRKALYEGYNFQQDPLDIIQPLPNYLQVEFDRFKASALKTPALRAAYLEAIRKAEAGAGMDAIEKKLRIAFYERNRYFANRIARTELHRAYTDQQARELMSQERIAYVQIRLSSKHPKTDICDYHAQVDLYGLGPGVYPKADAPKPPFHPHCYCLTAPRIDLINPKPRFNAKAERTFLATLPAKEAAQVAGSFEKRRRILEDKESLEAIYNEGKDELYKWKRIGEVGQTTAMPKVHPDLLRSGDTAAIQAAEALVKALTTPDWGTRTFKAGKMTQRTLDEFAPYQNIPEVKSLLESIRRGDPVDGLLLKWAKRRYLEKEAAIQTPDDLNQWFEQVLRDPNATFHHPAAHPNSRYAIHSALVGLLAVVDRSGQRVSVYQHDGTQLEAVWQTLSALIQFKTP